MRFNGKNEVIGSLWGHCHYFCVFRLGVEAYGDESIPMVHDSAAAVLEVELCS